MATESGQRINPEKDDIRFGARKVKLDKNFTYILLNKPKGIVTTSEDEKKRTTVLNLVETEKRIYPVGRLDMNTSGLLLLTDDGELSFRLAHPKYSIDKIYIAELHRPMYPDHRDQFRKGVDIGEDGRIRAKIKACGSKGNVVEVTVHEGKNRMLRRMFESLGYKVKSLERVRYAGLTKRKLPRGGWRFLTDKEVRELYKLVRL